MATNGPLVPSMIFKSRMTKQSSNVIEQNACNRSPGSSINLMRTSVISTAVLLALLTPDPQGPIERSRRLSCLHPAFTCFINSQPSGHLSGMPCGMADCETSRAAAAHADCRTVLLCQSIEICRSTATAAWPAPPNGCGLLGRSPSNYFYAPTPRSGSTRLPDYPVDTPDKLPQSQTFRRTNQHQVQICQASHAFDFLATASANRRTLADEKRHVAT